MPQIQPHFGLCICRLVWMCVHFHSLSTRIVCWFPQITLAVAQQFSPRSITGIDIDHKLIRIANKNLFRCRESMQLLYYSIFYCVSLIYCRQQIPAVTPDGRPFPSSFISSFPLLSAKIRSRGPRATTSPQPFPNNVSFSQVC